MVQKNVSINFDKKAGRLRPVNGMNKGPLFGQDLSVDFTEEFATMCVPMVRVSDVEPPHGGRFVDLHNVFPDFSLDERFELSYNFAPTDEYLGAVKRSGAEIFLRLGESYDPYEIKPYYKLPRDPDKWAAVCERILAHYNEGWGRGFKWGIKYVELTCDVDMERSGIDISDYFSFYRAVATRLKARFPRVRIGAYSSGGFFSLNHYNATPVQRNYVETLEKFLDLAGAEPSLPLDFLSWKCYAETPEELSLHASYARNYLDQSGFRKTLSIVSEFNLLGAGTGELFSRRDYPAKLVASLVIAQKSSIDMMFYADADPRSKKNCLYTLDDGITKRYRAAYRALCAFGALAELKSLAECTGDFWREIYTLAAYNGYDGAALVVTRDFDGLIELSVSGGDFASYSIMGLVGGAERGEGFASEQQNVPLGEGKILLRAGKNQVYLVRLHGKE